MNSVRIQLLEQYAKEDPHDPFPLYALGLELVEEHPTRAKEIFSLLMDQHPDYVPVYYHAAQLAITQSEVDRARSIVSKGVEKAKAARDHKAVAELENLLEEG
jgi:hypothetical protein